MKYLIGFGKFNKFYSLILMSALLKLLINISFKLEYQDHKTIEDLSILNKPELNNHIFIRFIYYYSGFIILSLVIFAKKYAKEKNRINYSKINTNEKEDHEISYQGKGYLIYYNLIRDKTIKSLPNLILIILAYIINEMIIFYSNQNNHSGVNF